MVWEIRQTGRVDEMSGKKRSLRIELHPDGDLRLCIDQEGIPIEDEHGNKACVEFCALAGGGGQSPHVRDAVLQLFAAIILDNRKDPSGIPTFPVGLKEAMEREIV